MKDVCEGAKDSQSLGLSVEPKKGCSLNHDASRSVEILTKEKEGKKSDDPSQYIIRPKPVIYGEEKRESPNSTGVKVEKEDDSYSLSMSKNSMALDFSKKVY